MAIVYQVYSNGGTGGPIDYSAPIATTSGTSYATATLAASGDYRFGVRAMDTGTGLVEANTQARVRIALGASGNDISLRPNAPFALVARPSADGGCVVTWTYFAAGQAAAPANFLVYLTPGTSPTLGTPAATVAYQAGVSGYSCQLAGLADGATYSIAVASQGAGAASSSPAATTTVVGDATPPGDVDGLAGVAIP